MTRCVWCASSLVDVDHVWPDGTVDYKCRSCDHWFPSGEKPHSEMVGLIIKGAKLYSDMHQMKIKIKAQQFAWNTVFRELGEFMIELQEFEKNLQSSDTTTKKEDK